jgi:hypothetical protein
MYFYMHSYLHKIFILVKSGCYRRFVHALPAKHPPKDQIIQLELPASHEPLAVEPERLPVACIFNSSLPSSLIDQVNILTSKLVLRGFVVCLYT